MSTALAVELHWNETAEWSAPVEVVDETDLRARYERLIAQVMRMGSWLATPQAQFLSREQWDELFARYQAELQRVRELGDELRPVTLRSRQEPLAGDALVNEVLELFAA